MVNPLNFLKSSRKKTDEDDDDAANGAPEGAEDEGMADNDAAVAAEETPASGAGSVAAEAEATPAVEPPQPVPQPPPPPPPVAPPVEDDTSAPQPAATPSPALPAVTPAPAPASGPPAGADAPTAPVQPRAEQIAPPLQPRNEPALPPPSRAEVEEKAGTAYKEALQAVGRFFQAARQAASSEGASASLPIEDVELAARSITRGMDDPHVGDALVALAVGPYPDEGRFIVPHSVNVGVLAQRVGRQLQLEGAELLTLAVAGLVHDVGTVRIPKETFYKDDSLSNDEWKLMRQRPTFSSEILQGMGPSYLAVAEIAHQVHERLDGNGYPRGLTVDSIALEASILGAVDIFEAFIHPRPYKKTVPAAAMYGVDNLMRMSHQFGDGVLKALVRSVGLFPVGTYLRLNSGEIARVLRGRSANPMRPEVEVVLDTQKRRLGQPRYIDLMATPHLYVFKPMSPEELREFDL